MPESSKAGEPKVIPKTGELKVIERKGRKITMVATGKKGFGAWKIVKNEALHK